MPSPWPRRGERDASSGAGAFATASGSVVAFLTGRAPSVLWAVTRIVAGSHTVTARSSHGSGEEGEEIEGWVAALSAAVEQAQEVILAPEAGTDHRLGHALTGTDLIAGSFLGTPLCSDQGVVGVLCGISAEPAASELVHQAALCEHLAELLTVVSTLEAAGDEAKLLAVEAIEQGRRDALTGVLNRAGWDEALDHETLRSPSRSTGASILIIDLDDLKGINDRFGHAHGDETIRAVAECITATARANDVVARLGGDEFGVLAPGSPPGTAEELAGRLRHRFRSRDIAASIGIAECPPGGSLFEAWRRADLEMYASKRLNGTSPSRPSPFGLLELPVGVARFACRATRETMGAFLRRLPGGGLDVVPADDASTST